MPSAGGSNWNGVPLEGVVPDSTHPVGFDVNRVGPAYFATLRIPVVRGREFDARDAAGAPPVAVINETMARRYWPEMKGTVTEAWVYPLGWHLFFKDARLTEITQYLENP